MTIFSTDNIRIDVDAITRDEALATVAAFAVERGYATDPTGVLAGLLERESLTSTALMDGIAIPHAKHSAITSPAILVERLARTVDWGDAEVDVLVAMLVPEAQAGDTHLHLLAQVSRAMIDDDVRDVLTSGDRDAIGGTLSARLDV